MASTPDCSTRATIKAPGGNRTHVSDLARRRDSLSTTGASESAEVVGIEPTQAVLETAVQPLHHTPVLILLNGPPRLGGPTYAMGPGGLEPPQPV